MSAMAGALGVQLEKVGHYRLGDPGRAVTADDVRAAQRIVIRGLALGALALAAGALVRRGGRGR
jgi:adenosylcobinamide-phosphate synthase